MSKVIPLASKQAIREEASLWLSRLDRGLAPAETRELQAWMGRSSAHRQALVMLASLWDNMSIVEELSSLFPLQESAAQQRPVASMANFYRAALMATILIGLLVGAIRMSGNRAGESEALAFHSEYTTRVGEQQVRALPDGSILQLNTDTRLDVMYGPDQRLIRLDRGEVHFKVTPDPGRPFVVQAGDRAIRAVGTAFNVQLQGADCLELVVTEGKVLLTRETKPAAGRPAARDDLILEAGEKVAAVSETLGDIERLAPADIQTELAWQRGFLIFEGEPLESVLAEVGRYTDMTFDIADEPLHRFLIAGYFKAGDVDGLLSSLRENFNIDSETTDNKHITLSVQP